MESILILASATVIGFLAAYLFAANWGQMRVQRSALRIILPLLTAISIAVYISVVIYNNIDIWETTFFSYLGILVGVILLQPYHFFASRRFQRAVKKMGDRLEAHPEFETEQEESQIRKSCRDYLVKRAHYIQQERVLLSFLFKSFSF
ncbi:MAG: hypothetical protein LBL47_00915 [Lactobacillus sp.]|jgi:hypothetical protein|nr:hypothetical protein [Lactobacillus sp.]